MPEPGYALLDCGGGKRLERIGGLVVARPAPAAEWSAALPRNLWEKAALSFSREHGWQGNAPENWQIGLGGIVLSLRPAGGGQIGVFPEHADVCDHLDYALREKSPSVHGWRALSLFGHTGMATLRLAKDERIAEAVHVDAQPSVVRQGKENAGMSGLAHRRIRWLVDDAAGFLAREKRRERQYDVIVADPPAYGRDRKTGGEWKLERDLPGLIAAMGDLLAQRGILCLTCHPAGWNARQLQSAVTSNTKNCRIIIAKQLALAPESAAPPLPAGLLVIAEKSA